MPQSMGELERDGLQLPAEDRAKLAVTLLCSSMRQLVIQRK